MANKEDSRTITEISNWCSEQQKQLDLVKTEEPDPMKNSSTKRKTRSMTRRSSMLLLDVPLTLKTEVPDTLMQTNIRETRTEDDNHGTVYLWRGNNVGLEVKEMLEAVEHHYPNTFHGVKIPRKPLWSNILKLLHAVIKSFMARSVDELGEEQLTSVREDLEVFTKLGFDLSWVQERLDMVYRLKFGNEPLQQEMMAIEASLGSLKEAVDGQKKQLMEAHDKYEKAQLEYDNAADARDKKAQEIAEKFGAEYDRIMKGYLGFGMLPGYSTN